MSASHLLASQSPQSWPLSSVQIEMLTKFIQYLSFIRTRTNSIRYNKVISGVLTRIINENERLPIICTLKMTNRDTVYSVFDAIGATNDIKYWNGKSCICETKSLTRNIRCVHKSQCSFYIKCDPDPWTGDRESKAHDCRYKINKYVWMGNPFMCK